ncbi:unnamed protein product [Rhizoctonia solani]|uniref:Uncharacterized protein n=1 Tax=Rhizoctonia solani TaxID=456999 RepID=A0A8H3GK55_9AGAM|nr:unnamed protein product [Rhizoctonia solani]
MQRHAFREDSYTLLGSLSGRWFTPDFYARYSSIITLNIRDLMKATELNEQLNQPLRAPETTDPELLQLVYSAPEDPATFLDSFVIPEATYDYDNDCHDAYTWTSWHILRALALTGGKFVLGWETREGQALVSMINKVIDTVHTISASGSRPEIFPHPWDSLWRPKRIRIRREGDSELAVINWPYNEWGTDVANGGLSALIKSLPMDLEMHGSAYTHPEPLDHEQLNDTGLTSGNSQIPMFGYPALPQGRQHLSLTIPGHTSQSPVVKSIETAFDPGHAQVTSQTEHVTETEAIRSIEAQGAPLPSPAANPSSAPQQQDGTSTSRFNLYASIFNKVIQSIRPITP